MKENVLRYVAGYVCRKIRKNLEKSKDKNENVMILCLLELSGDEMKKEEQRSGLTVFGKNNRLARKTNFFFIASLALTSSEDAAVQI